MWFGKTRFFVGNDAVFKERVRLSKRNSSGGEWWSMESWYVGG